MQIILYGKPGCHLCEGLQEKLEQIQNLEFELEIRDITTREDWFQAYQYEVPMLFLVDCRGTEGNQEEAKELPLPRPSPRATVQHLKNMLMKYL